MTALIVLRASIKFVYGSLNIMADEEIKANSGSGSRKSGFIESLVSIICYLGMFIAGAVVLRLNKKNSFIRFNAAQSVIFTLAIIVIVVVLNFIPIIGTFTAVIVALGGLFLWGVMIYKSVKHEEFRIPVVSAWADKWVERMDKAAADKERRKAWDEADFNPEGNTDDTEEGEFTDPTASSDEENN
jgi:uncharacterized membrane protein